MTPMTSTVRTSGTGVRLLETQNTIALQLCALLSALESFSARNNSCRLTPDA